MAIVESGRGKRIMDRIRQLSRDVKAAESGHLTITLDSRLRYARQMRLLSLFGSVLLTFFVLPVAFTRRSMVPDAATRSPLPT